MTLKLRLPPALVAALLSVHVCAAPSAQQEVDPTQTVPPTPPPPREFFTDGHPQAFFFQTQAAMTIGLYPDYATWLAENLRLNGTRAAQFVLDLEDRLAWFNQYAAEQPEKLTLLQVGGAARKAEPDGTIAAPGAPYEADDWLYFVGTTLTSPLLAPPPGPAVTVEDISVADTTVFALNVGGFQNTGDDIVIVERPNPNGAPDWATAEHVKLLSIDDVAGTIRVERARFGSAGGSFSPGAYVAPHVYEGPYADAGNPDDDKLWWTFDYSRFDTRNARRAEVDGWMNDDAPDFTGIHFDVMTWDPIAFVNRDGTNLGIPDDDDYRMIDSDHDFVGDNCVRNGINQYGLGTYRLMNKVRQDLGDRLVTADAQLPLGQRAFGKIHGVEIEGVGDLGYEYQLRGWSKTFNALRFAAERSLSPELNYINHKLNRNTTVEPAPATCVPNEPCNRNIQRLSLALGPLLDTGVTAFEGPPVDTSGEYQAVWDELWKGADRERNWLGAPVGPLRRLALEAGGDLLNGLGTGPDIATLWTYDPTKVEVDWDPVGERLEVDPIDGALGPNAAAKLTLTLPLPPGDLLVDLEVSADPMIGLPSDIPRIVTLAADGKWQSVHAPPDRIYSYADQDWFDAQFYWRHAGGDPALPPQNVVVELVFRVPPAEGREPVYIRNLTVHSAAPALARMYEFGAILANPSLDDYTFDLNAIFPPVHPEPYVQLHRLVGSPSQDPAFNDGRDESGGMLTLGGRDAIFLRMPD